MIPTGTSSYSQDRRSTASTLEWSEIDSLNEIEQAGPLMSARDRYHLATKYEAVNLALRRLAGESLDLADARAMRGSG
ncbi:hypothetical protein BH24ACT5_BH24ACT5_19120 [soil metagenome]